MAMSCHTMLTYQCCLFFSLKSGLTTKTFQVARAVRRSFLLPEERCVCVCRVCGIVRMYRWCLFGVCSAVYFVYT